MATGTINRAFVAGYVGFDPKTKKLDSGDTVVRLTVATSESWKDDRGERKERTTWHNICSFNQSLNKVFNERVKKGDLIGVEGQMQTRELEKDGQTKSITEIILQKYKGELTLFPKKGEPSP